MYYEPTHASDCFQRDSCGGSVATERTNLLLFCSRVTAQLYLRTHATQGHVKLDTVPSIHPCR
jgi:hypothetical protein